MIEDLDANKDGKISKDEARGRLKEDFDKIDLNKDGFIDREELIKAASERLNPPPLERKEGKRTRAEKTIIRSLTSDKGSHPCDAFLPPSSSAPWRRPRRLPRKLSTFHRSPKPS